MLARSANATIDYTALSNSVVVFNPGDTIQTITVSVSTSGVYPQTYYFEVFLNTSTAGTVIDTTRASTFVSILGSVGMFSFGSSNFTFLETAGTVNIPITRTNGSCGNVTLTYGLDNQTPSTAILGTNFVLVTPTVTFLDGQTQANLTITIIHTAVYEFYSLYFILNLQAPVSRGQLGAVQSTRIFIADDGDAGVFVFATPFTYCREDNGTAIVWINRTLGTSTSVVAPVLLTVETIFAGGNATEGGSRAFDYSQSKQVLSWADGETSKSFSVTLFNNAVYEPRVKTIAIGLTAVSGGASILSTSNTTLVYIVDDRDAGTFSFQTSNYSVFENASSVTVLLQRTGEPDPTGINTYANGSVSVDISTFNDDVLPGLTLKNPSYDFGVVANLRCTHVSPCSAVPGQHYTAIPTTTLSFAPGETAKNITIPILNNDLFEAPSRVFKIALSNVRGGAFIGLDFEYPTGWDPSIMLPLDPAPQNVPNYISTIVTILDDGDAAVLLGKASLSTSELGQRDTYSIVLNAAPTSSVTISMTLDSAQTVVSVSQVVFTPSNWNILQFVTVSAADDNTTQGIHGAHITHSAASTDSRYNGPIRSSAGGSGVVFSRAVYTAVSSDYNQGNELHAFPWNSSRFGVQTAPSSPIVNSFILDNDFASIRVLPEKVRHVLDAPRNFVCARASGRAATVTIALSSQPTSSVQVSLMSSSSTVVLSPSLVTVTPSQWSSGVIVNVTYAGTATPVTRLQVQLASSSLDAFFDGKTTTFYVEGYAAASVILDQTQIQYAENGNVRYSNYSIGVSSEPVHWEIPSSNSTPHTYRVMPSDDISVASNGTVTNNQVLYVASNGSESSSSSSVQLVALMRFPRSQTMVNTGSNRVGLANLRLFRLDGGDNQGLGGIELGVIVSSALWSEASCLNASCVANVLPNIPFGKAAANRSLLVGTSVISPTGAFNSSQNVYVSASGWVNIDVTAAWNAAANDTDITFILYALRQTTFVYNDNDEMHFASKEHPMTNLQPHIRLTSSGFVNLAQAGTASQSSGGADAGLVLASGGGSTMLSGQGAWWQVDWGISRLIESVVIQLVVPTPQSFSLVVALDSLSKSFQVSTTTSTQSIQLIWHVYGQSGNVNSNFVFSPSLDTAVEAKTCRLSSNNATFNLQSVQVFQVPMAATRVLLGGYLPSPSVLSHDVNELQLSIDDPIIADTNQCNANAICRTEVMFTSGNWFQRQAIHVAIANNDVATGTRIAGISHTSQSTDTDFNSSFVGLCTSATCSSPLQMTLPVSIQDDDEAGVVMSTDTINLVEGAANFPGAPVFVETKQWKPLKSPTCSPNANLSCASVFSGQPYTACFTSSASLFSNGSSWLAVRIPVQPPSYLLRELRVQLPALTVRALKMMTVWTSNQLLLNPTAWQKLETQTILFGSTTVVFRQVTGATNFILIQIEASYDESTNCVDIGAMELWGDVPLAPGAPVSLTRLSKTHKPGTSASISVRLLSEPLSEVIVTPLASSPHVIGYNRQNLTQNALSVANAVGGSYGYASNSANLPTALRFNASNWNQSQVLELSAVDDNIFKGNRSASISYTTSCQDSAATFPQSTVSPSLVTLTSTPLPAVNKYSQTQFVIADTTARDSTWPFHVTRSKSPSTGSILLSASIIEDDIPGITVSPAPLIVVENSSQPFNFSVVLDSQPTTVVTISMAVVTLNTAAQTSLVTIQPTSLSFAPEAWFTPQYVTVVAPYVAGFEGNESSTVSYCPTVPKKRSELMVQATTRSTDLSYQAIPISTNDPSSISFKVQGIPLVVKDIDTGCANSYEYSCAFNQPCVNDAVFGNRCNCGGIYGMRDCASSCSSASDCSFSRLQIVVTCSSLFSSSAACSSTFVPYNFVSQVHVMLQSVTFTGADGIFYDKQTRQPFDSSIYLVSTVPTTNPDTGAPSMQLVVDVADTSPFLAASKLQALFRNGFMTDGPLYATSLQLVPVMPNSASSSIVLWAFVGLISVGVAAVGLKFVRPRWRHIEQNKPVAPNTFQDPNELISATMPITM
ncbi:hypothetical protein Ae201684P_006607 [Aphanomyces euteiches]|uniref:Calx-beta domain-containing protein n=1 Tax=Aphanomyces euteiches TaxID=100861 RepID=A0A6G0XBU8_9STRA|nr:hypothetical protein Ae201684_006746 [Aphanomyces euteiches]KAH9091207.1 hypothetical protein Ae201684P_006607 [Aphanomyces euteiches]